MQLLLCNSIGIAVSFVPEINTGDKTPSRSLDVGCGVSGQLWGSVIVCTLANRVLLL